MKKIYLLFIMTIILGSCQKEELEKNIKNPSQQKLELIDYKDLPSPLLLNLQNFNYGLESKRARPFGEIDENLKIKRIVDKNGIPSYTFSLKKIDKKTSVQNSPGYYFDNLVVQPGKEYKTIILRYQPTIEWQTGNRDLRNFSGSILFFSVEGEKRNTIILENGVPIDSSLNNEKLVCHYTFSHAVIITSGDGSSSSSYTVYYYTEDARQVKFMSQAEVVDAKVKIVAQRNQNPFLLSPPKEIPIGIMEQEVAAQPQRRK